MIEQLCFTFIADSKENEEIIIEKKPKNRRKSSKEKPIKK